MKTARNKKKRVNEKLELIKHLYQKGFSKQDIINLLRFIDWVLELPDDVEPLFQQELEKFEKEKKMYYITQLQRPSYEKGMEMGVKKGREEAKNEGINKGISRTVSRQIAKKFNSDIRRELPRLRNLPTNDLLELAENIFSYKSLNSVHDWIKQKKMAAKAGG